MYNFLFRTVSVFTVAVAAASLFSSCQPKDVAVATANALPDLKITYPAAYVVNGGGNSISVIDLTTNEVKATVDLAKQPVQGSDAIATDIMFPHHAYLNSSKTQLAVGVPMMDFSAGHHGGMTGMQGKFAIVDASKGYITKIVTLPSMTHNATFSPDGKEIWAALMQDDGKVLVYDATTYALKNTITVGMQPAEVTFSADGSMVFVANGGSNTVTAINPTDKTVMATIPVGQDPVGAWVGADNKMYVDNETGHSVSVISVGTMAVTETVDLGFMPGMAAYNSDMKELWATNPDAGKVHWWYWDRTMRMFMPGGEIVVGAGAHAIAFKGMTAYITNQTAGTVSVVDVMMHTKTKDITVGSKPNGIALKY